MNGEVRLIQVDLDFWGAPRRSLHLADWTSVEAIIKYPRPDVLPTPPAELDAMVDIAERLSEGNAFLRVDLHLTPDGIQFGELTTYPAGGGARNSPEEFFTNLFRDWTPT